MTDPQLPPPGAVPPVPPVDPSAGGAAAPQPPAYAAPQPSVFPPAPYAQQTPQAAPPGAYQVPVGGYSSPGGAYTVPDTTPRSSGITGVLALVFGLIAALVAPILAGVFGFEIGARLPEGIDSSDPNLLRLLSPARDQVLWAEIAFWAGTVFGIAAIVLGIIAIRKKSRRALGIVGLVVAVLAPFFFWTALGVMLSVGTATAFMP